MSFIKRQGIPEMHQPEDGFNLEDESVGFVGQFNTTTAKAYDF